MNKIRLRQKLAILVTIFSGSVLLGGFILAVVTAVFNLCMLLLGIQVTPAYNLLVWAVGATLLVFGQVAVSNTKTELWVFDGVVLVILLLVAFFSGSIAGTFPYYSTIAIPSILAVLMITGFLAQVITFVNGLDDETAAVETV